MLRCNLIRTELFEEVIREEIDKGCFILNDTNSWVRMETHSRWTFEIEFEEGEFVFFFEDSLMSANGSIDGFVGSNDEAVIAFREFVRSVVPERELSGS